MSTRLVRELKDENSPLSKKLKSPDQMVEFNQRYTRANSGVDPLALKATRKPIDQRLDPGGKQFVRNMADGNVPSAASHRDLGKRMGGGHEGIADKVLMTKGGIGIRKTFLQESFGSPIGDRFKHMDANPELYPKMYAFRKSQHVPTKNLRTNIWGRQPSHGTHPAMFMEYVHGKDVDQLHPLDRAKAFTDMASKLKQKGFKRGDMDRWEKVGPEEAFYNPSTKEQIDDINSKNMRVRPNGKPVILDPIYHKNVTRDASEFSEIVPHRAFERVRDFDYVRPSNYTPSSKPDKDAYGLYRPSIPSKAVPPKTPIQNTTPFIGRLKNFTRNATHQIGRVVPNVEQVQIVAKHLKNNLGNNLKNMAGKLLRR